MENFVDPIEEQFNRIQSSKKQENQKKKVEFDVKNYLNVKLTGKETEKKLTIRILKLTPDSKTPFAEVHMHYLPSVKKSFVCTKQTELLPEGTDHNCPFCDIRDQAKAEQKGADQATWDKLKEIYKQNGSTLNYVVRVIDRDDEDFGVKFWKISQATYENIFDIYKNYKSQGIDVFDYEEGCDFIITIKKKDGKSKITNIMASLTKTPLASTKDGINNIVTDEKVWTDVYGIKPFEYLEIMIKGGTPFFDKTTMKWVEKKEDVSEDEDYEDEYHNDSSDETDENESSNVKEDDLPF